MKIEDIVVVEDKRGNKHFVKGSINGIAIKQVKGKRKKSGHIIGLDSCLLYTSPSTRDISGSRMPSSA